MQIILNSELVSTLNPRMHKVERSLSSIIWVSQQPKGFQYKAIDNIPESDLYNGSFVGLLSKAYSQHLPVSISPHDIWVVLLSEITKEIAEYPKNYRSLFTDSEEKKTLSVGSGSETHMPMNRLSELLGSKVKFDSGILFPAFSTQTPIITEVIQAIFCEMASPYYNYSMYCCGIPRIELAGTIEDWELLLSSWIQLTNVFNTLPITKYSERVVPILNQFVQAAKGEVDIDFWKDIFNQRNVGSGGDLVISGWITKLFMAEYATPKITHFTYTHGIVTYKNENTGRNFAAIYGGFHTEVNDNGYYQLQYNGFVFEKITDQA